MSGHVVNGPRVHHAEDNGPVDRSRIESILPLSPMQEALLYATLARSGEGPDPGLLQLRCTLRGELDESKFRHAWQYVITRHGALRSSVHVRDTDRPLQVVTRGIEAPLAILDLRNDTRAEQDARLQTFLHEDRGAGLDPGQAPVMRLAVFRVGDDEWELIWTCHHVLLDGWSGALVLRDVSVAYEALARDTEPRLPPAPPWRDFIAWLQRQDGVALEAFWRRELADLHAPTRLPFDRGQRGPASAPQHAVVTADLDAATTASLLAFARQHRLTSGTLVQGAWALLLAGGSDEGRPCFGVTVSGRAAPVPGIEAMVGVFNNALPLRAPPFDGCTAVEFLSALQTQLATLQPHGHASPSSIQAWSSLHGPHRLFDSLVVFENFPADVLGVREGQRLHWQDLRGGITSGHALVLVASPGERLALTLLHDPHRFDAGDARHLLDELRRLLERMAAEPESTAVGLLAPVRRVADSAPVTSSEPADARARPGDAPRPSDAATTLATAPLRSALELRLWKIWNRILGTSEFGADDDFFQLGGHSLLVARMLAAIETQLDVRLPVRSFFREPTIRGLAHEIRACRARSAEQPRSPWLVPLAPGSAERAALPPFFFMHGLQGDVIGSYQLVRHLSGDLRVFGVRADDPSNERTRSPERLEEMAAAYAREIIAVQPRGPYLLGGYCFGGTLAFETARQLAARGGDIGLIAVIDGEPRTPRWPAETRLAKGFEQLLRTPPAERAALLRHKVGKALRLLGGRDVGQERTRTSSSPADSSIGRQGEDLHFLAFRRYRPQPFDSRVTLIIAGDDPPRIARWRRAQWTGLARGGVDVRAVPGTHFDLLSEPWVRGVAECVQACVDEAIAGLPCADAATAMPSVRD